MTPIHIALAATAALAIVTISCSSHENVSASKPPVPVKVRAVSATDNTTLSRYSGALEANVRVDLAFRVSGYVEQLAQVPGQDGKPRNLQVGDWVKRGTLLARIRSSDYAQAVASASAAVAEARAEAKLAELELGRAQKLLDSKAISKAEFDTKVAKAEYSRANVDAASARAGEASVSLSDTILKAPLDGVILARDIEVGSLIAPGKPVLTVADTLKLKAVFAVPEALVEKLQLGSPVTVNVSGNSKAPAKVIEAQVTRLAPAADARGRVFTIEAELPNPNGELRAGTVISVHIPEATLASAAVSVPLSAVVRASDDQRGFAVYVVDGEAQLAKARRQRVELGEVLGNSVTVVAGLKLGQRVVTIGSTLIQDGSDTVVIP